MDLTGATFASGALPLSSLSVTDNGQLTAARDLDVLGPLVVNGGTLAGPAGSKVTALGGICVEANHYDNRILGYTLVNSTLQTAAFKRA